MMELINNALLVIGIMYAFQLLLDALDDGGDDGDVEDE